MHYQLYKESLFGPSKIFHVVIHEYNPTKKIKIPRFIKRKIDKNRTNYIYYYDYNNKMPLIFSKTAIFIDPDDENLENCIGVYTINKLTGITYTEKPFG